MPMPLTLSLIMLFTSNDFYTLVITIGRIENDGNFQAYVVGTTFKVSGIIVALIVSLLTGSAQSST